MRVEAIREVKREEKVVVTETEEVVGYRVDLTPHQMALLAKLVGVINNPKANEIGMPEGQDDLYDLYKSLSKPVVGLRNKMKHVFVSIA